METAELCAENYLKQHSLLPQRFSKEEQREGKTPDFRVFKQSDLVAYCEAKHVQRDEWLDEKLKKAEPLELVGGMRPDPIFNRLTAHIHTAAKQFAAVNPNREYPNILFFQNSDKACKMADLLAVLKGNFYAEGGIVEPIYKAFSEGRIKDEKLTIDVYLWLDDWKAAPQKTKSYYWEDSQHYKRVCELLQSDPKNHRHVP
jgi:hypothetical protein